MANNKKENKIEKFTKEAIGKTLNQFNREIGMADLVEINKNQDRILNGILSQVNDENTEKTEKSNIITLDNSTDGIVELKEIQGDTNVNVSKIEEMPITHDIGDKEGNVFTLNEITKGAISIGEIQGNTMVNCNKDDKKELVLMKDLSTQGDNNITLTEGVDGGLVDVALEGNTMVNVCDQKDSVALPFNKELTYLYANTQYTVQFISDKAITADITLGGTQLLAQSIVAGLNRISITTPATLVDNKLILDGVGAKISEVVVSNTDREFRYFEGMKSVGECEELAITSANSDNTLSNTQQLTHEPLRGVGNVKDRYVMVDGKWYIERNCAEVVFDETKVWGAIGCGGHDTRNTFEVALSNVKQYIRVATPAISPNYKNIMTRQIPEEDNAFRVSVDNKNMGYFLFTPSTSIIPYRDLNAWKTYLSNNPITVIYPLSTPTYEPLDYNPFTVYSEITHISNNSTIPCNMSIKNTGYNCLLKPSTTYTISSNLGLNIVTTPSVLTEDCLRFMDTDTSDVTTMRNVTILEGDYTTGKPIPSHFSGIESAFEQEYDEAVGKYKVKVRVQNEDASKENYIEFYINKPLRGIGDVKDKVYVKDDKVVVERNCEQREYQDGDFGTYLTDKVNTVYPLAEPTYEEVEYSSNRLILNTFNNESFNNSTLFLDTNILPKLSFKPLYEELVYVKNSTKYYIQFNAVGNGEVVINLGGTELTTEIVEGYNCIPITTPSESTNLMIISGQGITISEVVVSEVICGGYYKGLQSCFEEHIENGKYRVLLRGIALDGSKVNGIKLYINEPLRGIEGIKDRLCIKDGKLMVERKCGEIKLDENSNIISLSGLYLENTVIFKLDIPIKNYDYYICDNFECYYSMSLSNKDVEGTYSFDNSIRFRILRSKLNGESYKDFKQWLQDNPTTVVYQLAEPVYEEATNEYGLPIVFEGYENGIVYIDSAVTPTTHIKYTSNNQLATTLSEAEEQNNSTQDDINMNVVTYMMDIDMLLTEMEMSNDISVMAVRRDNSNENMLDRMSEEDKKVYRDNTVVMLEKMITANVLEKEDIEGRINMYYNKNRISKEQYEYLKSLL